MSKLLSLKISFFLFTLIVAKTNLISTINYSNLSSISLNQPSAMQLKIGQKFKINSRIKRSNFSDNFQWQDKDEWHLIECPKNITFIKSDATAPDYCGGDLLQRWIFKTSQSGNYDLKFKLHSKIVSVNIVVLDEVAPIEWQKIYYPINLEDKDEHYIFYVGKTLYIKDELVSPTVTVDDGWKLNIKDKIDSLKEDTHVNTDWLTKKLTLYQTWQMQFDKAGIYELEFSKESAKVLITIKVVDKEKV